MSEVKEVTEPLYDRIRVLEETVQLLLAELYSQEPGVLGDLLKRMENSLARKGRGVLDADQGTASQLDEAARQFSKAVGVAVADFTLRQNL